MKTRDAIVCVSAGLFLALFETTTLTFLTAPLSWFRLVIPVLVLFIISDKEKEALVFACTAGLITDVLALENGTFALARYSFIAITLAYAAKRIFTNHSLYSVAVLVIAARVLDWAWLLAVERFYFIIGSPVKLQPVWPDAWPVFVVDIFIVCFVFVIGNFVLKRIVGARRFLKFS